MFIVSFIFIVSLAACAMTVLV